MGEAKRDSSSLIHWKGEKARLDSPNFSVFPYDGNPLRN